MTVKHSDLTGGDLHGSRIPSSSTNRPPAYPGEAVITGGELAIAHGPNQADWKRYRPEADLPTVFSWGVGVVEYPMNPGSLPNHAAIFYRNCTAAEANTYRDDGFSLIQEWQIDQGLQLPGAVTLTDLIQARGRGCYVLCLGFADAYGGYTPVDGYSLSSISAIPQNAVQFFNFDGPFSSSDLGQWEDMNGFYVNSVLAQVLLKTGLNS